MTSPKTPSAKNVKPVKAWAIVDNDGFMPTVSACTSEKFVWRKFMMLKAYDEGEMQFYKRNGYRAIRVLITPLL
jgi:hypothetical protein